DGDDPHRHAARLLAGPGDLEAALVEQPGARLIDLEQGDVLARARELRPEEPAQRARPDDQDSHPCLPRPTVPPRPPRLPGRPGLPGLPRPARRTLIGSSTPEDASRRTTRSPRARPPWPSTRQETRAPPRAAPPRTGGPRARADRQSTR